MLSDGVDRRESAGRMGIELGVGVGGEDRRCCSWAVVVGRSSSPSATPICSRSSSVAN